MRKDLSKVITDTYRRGRPEARAIAGSRRKYRNRLDPDGEGGLKRIGMHGDILSYVDRKEFGDHISPLKRYLKRQVTRSWSDVHREICELADARSVVHWHLLLHLDLLVANKTVFRDGEVVLSACDGHRPVFGSTFVVYVHPDSGLLMPVVKAGSHGLSPPKSPSISRD